MIAKDKAPLRKILFGRGLSNPSEILFCSLSFVKFSMLHPANLLTWRSTWQVRRPRKMFSSIATMVPVEIGISYNGSTCLFFKIRSKFISSLKLKTRDQIKRKRGEIFNLKIRRDIRYYIRIKYYSWRLLSR